MLESTSNFLASVCRVCNFRSLCTRSKTDLRFIRDCPQAEHQAIQSIRQQQQTKEWFERYTPVLELKVHYSLRIRAFGLRRTRYLGDCKSSVAARLDICSNECFSYGCLVARDSSCQNQNLTICCPISNLKLSSVGIQDTNRF